MGLIEGLVQQPTIGQWPLIEPLILLMLVFLLPFIGLLLVSSAASVSFRALGRPEGLSDDLIDLALGRTSSWIIFGLVPLLTLILLCSQYFFEAGLPIGSWLLRLTVLFTAAFLTLTIYRRTLNVAVGALGTGLLLLAAFLFINTFALLADPEKWAFIRLPLPGIFSIRSFVPFLLFFATAHLFTGAAILFLRFQWFERSLKTPGEEQPLLKNVGLGMLLAGAVGIPPLLLWDSHTAPLFALRPEVFSLGMVMLLLLLIITLLTLGMITGRHTRHGGLTFFLALIVMALFSGRQQTLAGIANSEHELHLVAEMTDQRELLVADREELYAAAAQLDPDAGERIYNTICSACHEFDSRVVGPPYNAVLPKYVDDFDALTAFIFRPEKIDPDYPAMPGQGLKRAEARAVAGYLIEQFTGEPPGGSDPPETAEPPGGSNEEGGGR